LEDSIFSGVQTLRKKCTSKENFDNLGKKLLAFDFTRFSEEYLRITMGSTQKWIYNYAYELILFFSWPKFHNIFGAELRKSSDATFGRPIIAGIFSLCVFPFLFVSRWDGNAIVEMVPSLSLSIFFHRVRYKIIKIRQKLKNHRSSLQKL
jgi:hypothetical protein